MQEVQDNYDKNWWNKGYQLENPLVLNKLYTGTDNSYIRHLSHENFWIKNYVCTGFFFLAMSNEDIKEFMQLCSLEMKDKVHDTTLNQLRWLIAFGQGQTDLSIDTIIHSTTTLHFLFYLESINRTLSIHPRYANYSIFEEDMHGMIYPGLTCKELFEDYSNGEFEKLKGKIIDAIRPA
jgi:hypothetical protein